MALPCRNALVNAKCGSSSHLTYAPTCAFFSHPAQLAHRRAAHVICHAREEEQGSVATSLALGLVTVTGASLLFPEEAQAGKSGGRVGGSSGFRSSGSSSSSSKGSSYSSSKGSSYSGTHSSGGSLSTSTRSASTGTRSTLGTASRVEGGSARPATLSRGNTAAGTTVVGKGVSGSPGFKARAAAKAESRAAQAAGRSSLNAATSSTVINNTTIVAPPVAVAPPVVVSPFPSPVFGGGYGGYNSGYSSGIGITSAPTPSATVVVSSTPDVHIVASTPSYGWVIGLVLLVAVLAAVSFRRN